MVGIRTQAGSGSLEPNDAAAPPDVHGMYSSDAVNGIVDSYAAPPFHVESHFVERPGSGGVIHPILLVPGGHRVPIRATRDGPRRAHVRKDTYYIRRPGPQSAPPQTSDEWDTFLQRVVRNGRDQLMDAIRSVLEPAATPVEAAEAPDAFHAWISMVDEVFDQHAAERPDLYQHGTWRIAYALRGTPAGFDPPGLRDLLRRLEGNDTGWPQWLVIDHDPVAPRVVDDNQIEAWFGESERHDGSVADYWRVTPFGWFYSRRGYDSDFVTGTQPAMSFDVHTPIWRLAEAVRHAERMAEAFGGVERVDFVVDWNGLEGRVLTARPSAALHGDRRAGRDTAHVELGATPSELGTNLQEIILDLAKPLYWSFDFFELAPQVVIQEVTRMLTGRP